MMNVCPECGSLMLEEEVTDADKWVTETCTVCGLQDGRPLFPDGAFDDDEPDLIF
jgi:hypothetical protein